MASVPYARTSVFQPSLTVADLLLKSGQDQAEAERRRGEIAAQMWTGLGNTIAQIPNQIAQQKNQAIQQEGQKTRNALETAQLGDVQNAQRFKSDLGDVLKNTPQVDEDGVSVWNLKDIASQLADKGHGAYTGDVVKSLGGLNDSFRAERAAKLAVVQRGAQEVARAGNDPTLASHFLDLLEKNGTYPKETVAQYRQFIEADPANVAKLTAALSGPVKGEVVPQGATVIDPNTNQPVFQGTPKPPTETELALKAAGGDTTAQGAMKILKPGAKSSIEEEWLARDRRLAIAQNGGQPLSDAQQKTVDTKSMQEYAQSKADPEVRAAALAQKAIAASLAQMQIGMMPTKEQAIDIAKDLVEHRIAPEQLASLFSTRGKEGLAFKLNVASEAKKLDPSFNFEQASSEYQLAKSAGFQNTVRYMDSAIESIPRLLDNVSKLGRGNFRTWNEVANATANQFNSTDLKRVKTDALLVGDEVAKILSGGGTGSATSDAKLKQATDIIGLSDSVPAIGAAMEEINALLGNRRRALTRGTYMEGTSAVKPKTGTVDGVTYKVR